MFKLSYEELEFGETYMNKMKPLDIGIIIGGIYDGEIVMRTASCNKNEIMSLSEPGKDRCWDEKAGHKVKLLPRGAKIILEVI